MEFQQLQIVVWLSENEVQVFPDLLRHFQWGDPIWGLRFVLLGHCCRLLQVIFTKNCTGVISCSFTSAAVKTLSDASPFWRETRYRKASSLCSPRKPNSFFDR